MGARWGLLLLACGCRSLLGFDDPVAQPPPPIDTPIDEAPVFCFGTYRQVCLLAEPTVARAIKENFDTGSSDCEPTVTADNGFCVLAGTSITLTGVVRGVGSSRPLVLIATTGTIKIEGTLDLSSKRTGNNGAGSGAGTCTPGTPPSNSGGGGGGSLGALGGLGGDGGGPGTGGLSALITVPAPDEVRGGCPGATGGDTGGEGGTGGGAALLIAPSIDVPGTLTASGAGGDGGTIVSTAAGGGGSGGMLVFDAPSISLSGAVQAEGGGGGEGALQADGNAGQDPVFPGVGLGGSGSSAAGGDGGDGSSGAAGKAGAPGTSNGGGGGGGGGAGIIRVTSQPTVINAVSPTPQ